MVGRFEVGKENGAGDESIWHFVYGGSVEGRHTQHI